MVTRFTERPTVRGRSVIPQSSQWYRNPRTQSDKDAPADRARRQRIRLRRDDAVNTQVNGHVQGVTFVVEPRERAGLLIGFAQFFPSLLKFFFAQVNWRAGFVYLLA